MAGEEGRKEGVERRRERTLEEGKGEKVGEEEIRRGGKGEKGRRRGKEEEERREGSHVKHERLFILHLCMEVHWTLQV